MSFQGLFEWLAQSLLRIEVLVPIFAGAAILTLLVIRRRGSKRNVTVEEVKVVEEEAERLAEKPPEVEDELLEARIKTLEVLRTRGALRPAPLAASKEGGHYPDIVGIPFGRVEGLIKDLVRKGLIFEGEAEFSTISCPLCGSSSQAALASCKNCGSLRVHELKYYRHACGYMGPESSFLGDGELICPQCRSSEGIELYYKRYHCDECKTDLDEVNIAFKCGSCGSLYDESSMALKQFKRIEISREGLREYEEVNRMLTAQIQKFRAEGYIIEKPASLVGESGVIHSFDAVAKRGEEVIAMVSSFGKALTQLLFELGVSKMDLKLSRLIVITGKPTSPAEKEFARSLGIEIVEPTRL